ncbi:hypothetical protein Scep_027930 [Stephania cephalantha]|uniref:RNase H type-1 domain-containing protein n=1 Tax=Stephania cephalantha TaxID=152367 RepID=A0AAP0EC45_9MAGN
MSSKCQWYYLHASQKVKPFVVISLSLSPVEPRPQGVSQPDNVVISRHVSALSSRDKHRHLDIVWPRHQSAKEVLSWIKERNIQKVTVESDCLQVVQAVKWKKELASKLGIFVSDCIFLSNTLTNVEVEYVRRFANLVAHTLAQARGSMLVTQVERSKGLFFMSFSAVLGASSRVSLLEKGSIADCKSKEMGLLALKEDILLGTVGATKSVEVVDLGGDSDLKSQFVENNGPTFNHTSVKREVSEIMVPEVPDVLEAQAAAAKACPTKCSRIKKLKQSKEAAEPGTVDVDWKSAPQPSQPIGSRSSRPPCNDFLDLAIGLVYGIPILETLDHCFVVKLKDHMSHPEAESGADGLHILRMLHFYIIHGFTSRQVHNALAKFLALSRTTLEFCIILQMECFRLVWRATLPLLERFITTVGSLYDWDRMVMMSDYLSWNWTIVLLDGSITHSAILSEFELVNWAKEVGLLRDKWAPPRRAGLLRDLQAKNTPSVSSHQYMPGQHPRNIYWNTNEYK